jgi:hypothetical protein
MGNDRDRVGTGLRPGPRARRDRTAHRRRCRSGSPARRRSSRAGCGISAEAATSGPRTAPRPRFTRARRMMRPLRQIIRFCGLRHHACLTEFNQSIDIGHARGTPLCEETRCARPVLPSGQTDGCHGELTEPLSTWQPEQRSSRRAVASPQPPLPDMRIVSRCEDSGSAAQYAFRVDCTAAPASWPASAGHPWLAVVFWAKPFMPPGSLSGGSGSGHDTGRERCLRGALISPPSLSPGGAVRVGFGRPGANPPSAFVPDASLSDTDPLGARPLGTDIQATDPPAPILWAPILWAPILWASASRASASRAPIC